MRAGIVASFFVLFSSIATLVWIGGSKPFAVLVSVTFGLCLLWADAVFLGS